MNVHIRRAIPEEAPILTSIALESKAVWGYDKEFIEQCREELTLTPEYVRLHEVYVAQQHNQIVGFYGLTVDEGRAILDYLYMIPASLRQGVGRQLWDDLIKRAKSLGVSVISIDADPHAERFYLHGSRAGWCHTVWVYRRSYVTTPTFRDFGIMNDWIILKFVAEGATYEDGMTLV
ncbi:GNAT family N-acetyltransferase [Alicyclobacillus kakegawensis]|uniref:GNAT family N-acetyltransferase n=1 Tax=Alicyclobacillus kakegawensis TaxID=392012 RepID=UPI00082A2BF6|nr:GNAT family N-acetyltransferase [Alicyclobacillus kakegawensis]